MINLSEIIKVNLNNSIKAKEQFLMNEEQIVIFNSAVKEVVKDIAKVGVCILHEMGFSCRCTSLSS
jgi:hypothetical protein